MPTSKRTWSLPLPVQPWERVVARWGGAGRLGKMPRDERTRQCADQRVAIHVQRVGSQRRAAEVFGKLVFGINNDSFDRPAVHGPLTNDVHVLPALANVDR